MMVSLLIEGLIGPKHNINVYSQLLIEELNILWGSGISTWDASTKQLSDASKPYADDQ